MQLWPVQFAPYIGRNDAVGGVAVPRVEQLQDGKERPDEPFVHLVCHRVPRFWHRRLQCLYSYGLYSYGIAVSNACSRHVCRHEFGECVGMPSAEAVTSSSGTAMSAQ